jgi:hypothetical protein
MGVDGQLNAPAALPPGLIWWNRLQKQFLSLYNQVKTETDPVFEIFWNKKSSKMMNKCQNTIMNHITVILLLTAVDYEHEE